MSSSHKFFVIYSGNLLKQVLSFALDFFLIYVKMTSTQFLADIYFLLKHAWKVPVLQELLNTSMNDLYVEEFDDYEITEMINMLCSE